MGCSKICSGKDVSGGVFTCPACTPDMLAVSVDGNRKHYRFKNKASTEKRGLLDQLFIQSDVEVSEFVDYVRKNSDHVKYSGAYQEGAGSTIGEEVEQVNSFLSRIAVTSKYMSKSGRADMITMQAMLWNKRKILNLGQALVNRYVKTQKALQMQQHSLEELKTELSLHEDCVHQWVSDVQQWAEESAPFLTKRKVFDKVMAVRRLQEERGLICKEVKQHWTVMTQMMSKFEALINDLSSKCQSPYS
ncbi:hypothetical protein cypCar_00022118 [Cyprinus carpio]|nr:hypothetical protein cypCar_00022118 [Cyprinus carpio]